MSSSVQPTEIITPKRLQELIDGEGSETSISATNDANEEFEIKVDESEPAANDAADLEFGIDADPKPTPVYRSDSPVADAANARWLTYVHQQWALEQPKWAKFYEEQAPISEAAVPRCVRLKPCVWTQPETLQKYDHMDAHHDPLTVGLMPEQERLWYGQPLLCTWSISVPDDMGEESVRIWAGLFRKGHPPSKTNLPLWWDWLDMKSLYGSLNTSTPGQTGPYVPRAGRYVWMSFVWIGADPTILPDVDPTHPSMNWGRRTECVPDEIIVVDTPESAKLFDTVELVDTCGPPAQLTTGSILSCRWKSPNFLSGQDGIALHYANVRPCCKSDLLWSKKITTAEGACRTDESDANTEPFAVQAGRSYKWSYLVATDYAWSMKGQTGPTNSIDIPELAPDVPLHPIDLLSQLESVKHIDERDELLRFVAPLPMEYTKFDPTWREPTNPVSYYPRLAQEEPRARVDQVNNYGQLSHFFPIDEDPANGTRTRSPFKLLRRDFTDAARIQSGIVEHALRKVHLLAQSLDAPTLTPAWPTCLHPFPPSHHNPYQQIFPPFFLSRDYGVETHPQLEEEDVEFNSQSFHFSCFDYSSVPLMMLGWSLRQVSVWFVHVGMAEDEICAIQCIYAPQMKQLIESGSATSKASTTPASASAVSSPSFPTPEHMPGAFTYGRIGTIAPAQPTLTQKNPPVPQRWDLILKEGEYIVGVRMKFGSWLEQIEFTMNTGRACFIGSGSSSHFVRLLAPPNSAVVSFQGAYSQRWSRFENLGCVFGSLQPRELTESESWLPDDEAATATVVAVASATTTTSDSRARQILDDFAANLPKSNQPVTITANDDSSSTNPPSDPLSISTPVPRSSMDGDTLFLWNLSDLFLRLNWHQFLEAFSEGGPGLVKTIQKLPPVTPAQELIIHQFIHHPLPSPWVSIDSYTKPQFVDDPKLVGPQTIIYHQPVTGVWSRIHPGPSHYRSLMARELLASGTIIPSITCTTSS